MKCRISKEKCPFPPTFWDEGMARDSAVDNCPIGKYKDSCRRNGILTIIDDRCRFYGFRKPEYPEEYFNE